MGQLVEGVWQNVWYDTKSTGGRFKRVPPSFRSKLGSAKFPAVAGRYFLYVSLACPWAHRVLVVRALKKLEHVVNVAVVHPLMLENGWAFGTDFPGTTGDPVNGKKFLHEVYSLADPKYTGRVTVPVLWDTVNKTIVNNESSELIEMFNTAFNHLEGVNADLDLCPESLKPTLESLDADIYPNINNGVYKAGFSTTQDAYDEAIGPLFDRLDFYEELLSKKRYLSGPGLTLSDVRLWTTLIRFDHVYVTHFKCDKKRMYSDYPNLFGFIRDIYQMSGVADTVSLDHIRNHYYRSHPTINPYGIIPIGPEVDWTVPARRENL